MAIGSIRALYNWTLSRWFISRLFHVLVLSFPNAEDVNETRLLRLLLHLELHCRGTRTRSGVLLCNHPIYSSVLGDRICTLRHLSSCSIFLHALSNCFVEISSLSKIADTRVVSSAYRISIEMYSSKCLFLCILNKKKNS